MTGLAEQMHLVDFDCPWRIEDGRVVEVRGQHAPSVYNVPDGDVEVDGAGWEAVSANMTGQEGYHGPVLHSSEGFSAGMAERFAELQEDFVCFATTSVECDHDDSCPWTAEECGGYHEAAGWIVVGLRAS